MSDISSLLRGDQKEERVVERWWSCATEETRSFQIHPIFDLNHLPKELCIQRDSALYLQRVLDTTTCLELNDSKHYSERQKKVFEFWEKLLPHILDPTWLSLGFHHAKKNSVIGTQFNCFQPSAFGSLSLRYSDLRRVSFHVEVAYIDFVTPLLFSTRFMTAPLMTDPSSTKCAAFSDLHPLEEDDERKKDITFAQLVLPTPFFSSSSSSTSSALLCPPLFAHSTFVRRSFYIETLDKCHEELALFPTVLVMLVIEYTGVLPIDNIESYTTPPCHS